MARALLIQERNNADTLVRSSSGPPLVQHVTLTNTHPSERLAETSRTPSASVEPPPLPAVLIVDDDPLFRLLTRLLLESRGCTVSLAEGCEEALQILGSAKPTLALVDMVMPGIDGLGTISALRAQSADLQFIACSGHDADYFRDGLAELKVGHFLAKPFTVDALIAMMQRMTVAQAA